VTQAAAASRIWVVGDLQGCLTPFQELLSHIRFDPLSDHIVLAGDLINRGPQSLATLRYVRNMGEHVTALLGNHDLHFLAVLAGVRKLANSDTLQELLQAADLDELSAWLRQLPLTFYSDKHLVTHAGCPAQWDLDDALREAHACEQLLRAPNWHLSMASLFGNQPARWQDAHTPEERKRYTINALTRMRFVQADGSLDFATKEGATAVAPGLLPWFDVPGHRALADARVQRIVFGHWSTLGVFVKDALVSLDAACVWGGCLAAYQLRGPEQGLLEQVQC
jgi:bis(5'-nucleosyl)-tetraphosphatase (symmetrical)